MILIIGYIVIGCLCGLIVSTFDHTDDRAVTTICGTLWPIMVPVLIVVILFLAIHDFGRQIRRKYIDGYR